MVFLGYQAMARTEFLQRLSARVDELRTQDGFSRMFTVQPDADVQMAELEPLFRGEFDRSSVPQVTTAQQVIPRFFRGLRVIVCEPDFDVTHEAGMGVRFAFGDTFVIRKVLDDGSLLVGTTQGECPLPANKVLPIHESFEFFEEMIAREPLNAKGHAALGIAWSYADTHRAMPYLNRAIELDQNDARSYFYRSGSHMPLVFADEQCLKLEDERKALELGKSDPLILAGIAKRSHSLVGLAPSVSDEIELAEKAVSLAPNFGDAYYTLARFYQLMDSGSSRYVRGIIDRGLAKNPNHPSLHNLYGIECLRHGNELAKYGDLSGAIVEYGNALASFSKAYRINPLGNASEYNAAITKWALSNNSSTTADVVDQRFEALLFLTRSLSGNWRYSKALTKYSDWLGGGLNLETKNAFSLMAEHVKPNETGLSSQLTLTHLRALLELQPEQVRQGMTLVEGMDFAKRSDEPVRVASVGSNLELALLMSSEGEAQGRPTYGRYHGSEKMVWPSGVVYSGRSKGLSALSILCEGYPDAAVWALINGADPDFRNEDNTRPIHSVLMRSKNSWGLLRLLLERGADPNPTDLNGHSPLASCVQEGDYVAVLILRSYGAKWGLTDDEGSAIAVLNSRFPDSKPCSDEEAADKRAIELCTQYLIDRMKTQKGEDAERIARTDVVMTAPKFYESEPVSGQSPREIGVAADNRMKQWQYDTNLHNRLKTIHEENSAKVKPILEMIAKSNQSAMLEWANLLLPDENLRVVIDALGESTATP